MRQPHFISQYGCSTIRFTSPVRWTFRVFPSGHYHVQSHSEDPYPSTCTQGLAFLQHRFQEEDCRIISDFIITTKLLLRNCYQSKPTLTVYKAYKSFLTTLILTVVLLHLKSCWKTPSGQCLLMRKTHQSMWAKMTHVQGCLDIEDPPLLPQQQARALTPQGELT